MFLESEDLDLPVGSAWSYEAVAYSTESRGKSYRAGVRDDKLNCIRI